MIKWVRIWSSFYGHRKISKSNQPKTIDCRFKLVAAFWIMQPHFIISNNVEHFWNAMFSIHNNHKISINKRIISFACAAKIRYISKEIDKHSGKYTEHRNILILMDFRWRAYVIENETTEMDFHFFLGLFRISLAVYSLCQMNELTP